MVCHSHNKISFGRRTLHALCRASPDDHPRLHALLLPLPAPILIALCRHAKSPFANWATGLTLDNSHGI
eukprot:765093-Hanusia_phi.AAC.3